MNKKLILTDKNKKQANSQFKKSLFSFLLFLTSFNMFGHSVQVNYCVTEVGTIRLFIEHWHGNLSFQQMANAQVQIFVDDGSTVTQEFYPAQGAVINTTIDNLPGCKTEMVVLSQCTSRSDGRNANTQNDWGYWDFVPPACGAPLTLTVNAVQGSQAFIFLEGCDNLFPTSFTATFEDCAEPQLTCPDDITTTAGPDCTAMVTGLNPDILFDDCTAVDDLILSYEITGATSRSGPGLPDGLFNVGTSSVTILAEDETGKIGECTMTVTVQDESPPTIDCSQASDMLSITCATSPPPLLDVGAFAVMDNCTSLGDILFTIDETETSPETCPAGSSDLIRTYSFADEAGNIATCVQTITFVDDTEAPTVVGATPTDANLSCDEAAPPVPTVEFTDNCTDPVNVEFFETFSPDPDCPTSYSLTRTWIATDDCSNEIIVTQTITVTDDVDPLLDPIADLTIDCDDQAAGEIAAWLALPTGTDNCGSVSITHDWDGSIPDFCAGESITITYTATDLCGNTTVDQGQIIGTADVTGPMFLNCPSDFTVNADFANCGADIVFSTPIAEDCGEFVNVDYATGSLQSGDIFPEGTSTITFEATDLCGNITTCTFDLTVVDDTTPTISCPSNTVTNCADPGACTWTSDESIYASYTDNCADFVVTYAITGATSANGTGNADAIDFELGTSTVTYTITDNSTMPPLVATCLFDVRVEDCEAPTFTCSDALGIECGMEDLQQWLDDTEAAIIANGDIAACSEPLTVISQIIELDQSCGDSYTRTYLFTATDQAGNSGTCEATYSVVDNTAPIITAATDLVIQCSGTSQSIAINTWLSNQGNAMLNTEDCGDIIWTNDFSGLTDDCNETGTADVLFTATDACGNTATTTATVTIQDTIAPTLLCADDIIVECGDPNTDNIVTSWLLSAQAEDECGDVTVTNDYTALPECGSSTTVTFTISDSCDGTVITCTAQITLDDTTPPVVTTPPTDLFVECDGSADPGGAIAAWLALNGGMVISDACDPASIVANTIVNSQVTCNGAEDIIYQFTATDQCGNLTVAENATVHLIDTTPPAVTVPDDTTVSCDASPDPVAWSQTFIVSDDCDLTPMVINHLEGIEESCDGTLQTTVYTYSFYAIDNCGNTDGTITRTYTVQDLTNPMITPPDDLLLDCTDDAAIAVIAWLDDYIVSDNCNSEDELVVTNDFVDVPEMCGGSVTVTWSVTDACGATGTGSADIIISDDTTGPSIVCPDDLVLICNDSNNDALIASWLVLATGDDDCSDVEITHDYDSMLTLDCTGALGTVVTFTAVDDCDNETTCTASIFLEDDEVPIITTFASDYTIECSAADFVTQQNDWIENNGGAVATDNCDDDITWTATAQTAIVGCGGTSTTPYLFTATDDCGNIATSTASFIVEDESAPTVIPPAPLTVECNGSGNQADLASWLATAMASDGCSQISSIESYVDNTISGCGNTASYTYRFEATDECGFMTEEFSTFTILDETPPTIDCPVPLTLECGNPNNLTLIAAWLSTATAADGCNDVSISNDYVDVPSTLLCNGGGMIDVTFTAVDDCDNLIACVTQIILDDTTPPTFENCPMDIVLNTDGDCGNTYLFSAPPASDNCEVTVTQTAGSPSGTLLPLGETTIEFTATDGCGNTEICSYTVTVVDTADPMIGCPSIPVVICADTGTCQWVSDDSISPNVETGDCPQFQVTYAISGATSATGDDDATGEIFNLGTSTVTYTIEDGSGNISTCNFDVIVDDCESPVLTCAADITVTCGNLETALADWQATVTATDNCDINPLITPVVFNTMSGCGQTDSNTYLFTASDAAGNTSTCLATYTIVDNTAPEIICPPILELECGNANNEAFVSNWLSTVTASDGCSTPTITNNYTTLPTDLLCEGGGMITVIFTAEDDCDNVTTCTAEISIEDTTVPTFDYCPADITLNADGECGSTPIFSSPTAMDNCDVTVALTSANASGTEFPLGTTPVEYTATDRCGNTAICTWNITVVDNIDPIILCPSVAVAKCVDFGTCSWISDSSISPAFNLENCPDFTITYAITGATTATGSDNAAGEVLALGTSTVTYTMTDASDNVTTCSFDVIVSDCDDPILACPTDLTVVCGDPQATPLADWQATATATDNCDASITVTPSLFNTISGCGNTLSEVYLFTATDAEGNTSTCLATYTIIDNQAPEIICPAAPLSLECNDTNNTALITAWLASVSAEDNCDTPLLTHNYVAPPLGFTCDGTGLISVVFTATDACGNSSVCIADITLNDTQAPTIECPSDLTLSCNNVNNAALINNWLDLASGDDSCADITVTHDYTSGLTLDCNSITGTVVTFTATDDCDNTTSCTASIILNDNEVPVITSFADDLILECGEANNEATISNWIADNGGTEASDNCDMNMTWTAVADVPEGTCGSTTITSYTFTVSDACGNTAIASANVQLLDTTDPILTVPVATTVECNGSGNQAELSTWLASATAEDTCDEEVTVTTLLDNTVSGCGSTETYVYLFTATDACGNSLSEQSSFVIEDRTAPTITCPAIPLTLQCGNPNNLTLVSAWLSTVTAADDCSEITITNNFIGLPTDLVCNGGGTVTVTFTASDACGNDSQCTGQIIIDDTIAPTFVNCPADVTLNTDDACGNTPIFSLPDATDECSVTVTQTGGPASGTVFPLGTTTLEFTATDECGNTDVCEYDITVVDLDNPEVSCPIGNTVKCADTGTCVWTSDTTVAPNTGLDDCPGISITYTITGATQGSGLDDATGEIFNIGTSTVTYTIQDGSDNSSTCSFDVVVQDCEDPVISCATDLIVTCSDAAATSIDDWQSTVSGSDNCDTPVDISALLFNTVSGCGNTMAETYLFTATDEAGNTSTCLSTYTIEDITPPEIICPADLTLECGDPNNPALIVAWLATTSATDGCDIPTLTHDYSHLPSDLDCMGGGSLTVTFRAVDACDNETTCTSLITMTDTTAPTFEMCPADITLNADGGCGSTPIFSTPIASDNCNVTVAQTSGLMSGVQFPLGTTTVEFMATDACGNTAVCAWDISVVDITDPIVSCPSVDIVQCTDIGTCMWVSDDSVSPSFSTEDCPDYILTYSISGATTESGSDNATGVVFQLGTSTVTYTMTDGSGNVTSCSFDVVIQDCEAPVLTCPMEMIVECNDPAAMTVLDWQATAVATDNCASDITIEATLFNSVSGCGGTSSQAYLFTATDAAGNQSTCIASYILQDTSSPTITCPQPLVLACGDPNNASLIGNWLAAATTTDECGSPTITHNYVAPPQGFVCNQSGLISVVFTSTDECGLTSNCTADILINDTELPVITCPDDLTLECNNVNNTAIINSWLALATAQDNCSDVQVVNDFSDMLTLDCSGANGTIITFTASDECDNTVTCTASIFLEDDELPMIITPPTDLSVECDGAGNITEIQNWLDDNTSNDPDRGMEATDNCGMVSLTVLEASRSDECGNTTIITYTYTVTDVCGNMVSVNANVNITDTTDPVLTPPTATDTASCDVDFETAFDLWLNSASATDLCGTAEVSAVLFQEQMICAGTNSIIEREYTFTATDACNNQSTANATFTIIDDIDPTIQAPADLEMGCGDDFSAQISIWLDQYTVIDACQQTTVSHDFDGQVPDQCGGSITVTWTVMDDCGATSTASADIIITADTTPPSIDFCPADLTFTTEAGQCDAVINYGTPTATDCNGPVTIVKTSGPDAGTMVAAGMTETIEFTATDGCGNASICTFTVTVIDEQLPVITCPSNDVVKCNSTGTCTWISDNDVSPINSSDNCPNYTVNYIITGATQSTGVDDAAGEIFNLGESTVTYQIMDAMGNPVSTCTFMVVVQDCEDPTILCNDVSGVACNAQSLTDWYMSIVSTVADNCDDDLSVDTLLLTDFSTCGNTFDRVYQYTVTDAAGNMSSCLARYMTIDDVEPVITTEAQSLSVECDGTNQSILFQGWLNSHASAVATDECGGPITWSNDFNGSVTTECSGTTDITVTFTATDECGNASTTTATFRIEDTTAPILNLPNDLDLSCGDPFNAFFTLTWINGASANDVCNGFTFVSNDYPGTMVESCGSTTVQTITFTASDLCGNVTTDTRTVTTSDTTPPTVLLPAQDIVLECGSTQEITTWLNSNGGAIATDDCSDEQLTWTYTSDDFTPVCGAAGEVVYTFVVTDNCGNSTATTASLITEDRTPPLLTVPTDYIEECGSVTTSIEDWIAQATATDACGTVEITSTLWDSNIGCGGTLFERYLFTAIDQCGNVSTDFGNYRTVDTTDPLLDCPADLILECGDQDNAILLQSWLNSAVGVDANGCSTITVTADPPSELPDLSCDQIDGLEVTFIATDDCGNSTTCIASIYVIDTVEPVFLNCPSDIVINVDVDICGANPIFSTPIAADDCSVTVEQTAGLASGSEFPLGETQLEYTATDLCGNTSVCAFTLTVVDSDVPMILCPSNGIEVATSPGLCVWMSDDQVAPSISVENCPDQVITYTITGATNASGSDNAAGVTFNLGVSEVCYTITDGSGNVAMCCFEVTVVDLELPMIVCPADILIIADSEVDGICVGAVDWTHPIPTDNCGVGQIDYTITHSSSPTVSLTDVAAGEIETATFVAGTSVVEYTVTDSNGNTQTCQFNVDVIGIKHEKTLARVTQNPDDSYCTEYNLRVYNTSNTAGTYSLYDLPDFDDDIVILSAEYSSSVHVNTQLATTPPASGWSLATDQLMPGYGTHLYVLTVCTVADLKDEMTPGDGLYSVCGTRQDPATSDDGGQGLFNESLLDVDGDALPDARDTVCADIPYITHAKDFLGYQRNADGTYDVQFKVTVENIGGAPGAYDLWDQPYFDDDFIINSGTYSTDIVSGGGELSGALVGTGPWVLADDQGLDHGETHCYTLTVNVSINLSNPSTLGDEIYTYCGSTDDAGVPQPGEGLYNETSLDRSNDGIPEEVEYTCGDIEIVDLALAKVLVTQPPYNYGDILTFDIEITNQGNIDLYAIEINDYVPIGYAFTTVTTNDPKWSMVSSGVLRYDAIAGPLAPNQSIIVSLDLELLQTTGGANDWDNRAELAYYEDANGVDKSGEDIDSTPDNEVGNDNPVMVGGVDDNVITGGGPLAGEDEDDHDPAGPDIFDLALRKTLDTGNTNPVYGGIAAFNIEVFNQGNEDATHITVTDAIPCGFTFDGSLAANTGWTYNLSTNLVSHTIQTILAPGTSQVIPLQLRVAPCTDPSAFTNYAEISQADDTNPLTLGLPDDVDSTPDSDLTNDVGGTPNDAAEDNNISDDGTVDEDDHDPEELPIFDLALRKTIANSGPYNIGQTATFEIEIFNQGNVTADQITVNDYLSSGYTYDPVLNPDWTNTGGILSTVIATPLVGGASTIVTLDLIVSIDSTPANSDWYNYAEIANAIDANGVPLTDIDSTPSSNSAAENAVLPGDADDNNINGLGPNAPQGVEDEDDHDPAAVIVVGGLGDTVWKDLDGNGIQDTGELGVAGVVVTAFTCSGDYIAQMVTDGDGHYFFRDLLPGDYYLSFDISNLPQGCTYTLPGQGNSPDLDSNVDINGLTSCITVLGGEFDDSIDVGLIPYASLGDLVWHDLDGDGIQDLNESGIAGVAVALYDSNGNVIDTKVTDTNGYYLFDDLYPGDYYLDFIAPMGYQLTLPHQGSNTGLDSDVNESFGPGTTSLINLSAGENDLTWDAGYYKCIPLGDIVWYDADGDGIQDIHENGINGIKVNVYRAEGSDYVLYDYQYTGHKPGTASDDGYWNICVPPGTYYVKYTTPPGGLGSSLPDVGNDDSIDSDITNDNGLNTTDAFTVVSCEEKTDIGAGFANQASLSGTVWIDVDGDGGQEDLEPIKPGVSIQVYNSDGILVTSTVTDLNGNYSVTGLMPIEYYIGVTLPSGMTPTISNAQPDDIDSDLDHTHGLNTTDTYLLIDGENVPNIDIGLLQSVILSAQSLDLSLTRVEEKNTLQWTMIDDQTVSYYTIEKRVDTATFEEVGSLLSNQQSNAEYDFIDYNSTDVGLYYYRIIGYYESGDTVTSRIVSISVEDDRQLIPVRLYPIPAANTVTLEVNVMSQGTKVGYSLIDRLGRYLVSQEVLADSAEQGLQKYEIDLSQYLSGVYTVEIRANNMSTSKQLIIIE